MNRTEVLQKKRELLRDTHRELDEAIVSLEGDPLADRLRLVRMKKRKLSLKDQIARLDDELTPDIIA